MIFNPKDTRDQLILSPFQKQSIKNELNIDVVELHILSVKSTLLAVSRPFQTLDRVRNTFQFCHSSSRYRCYMLTRQALTYTEDPKYELAGPFGTMPQEP